MQSRWRQRTQRVVGTVLIASALGVTAAACSSAPAGRGVASLPGTSSADAASGSPPPAGSYDQGIVDYTRCLRSHGVNEPDPTNETRDGRTGLSFAMPPQTEANRPALTACNHFIARLMAAKATGASHELARWLPSLVRYASCMRSHDISMLDPGLQGQLSLGNVPGITGDFGRYSPQFRAADSACRHLLPAGVHDDGTGP
jgi:hypothetical protein